MVRDELRRSGFEDLISAGIVLTGGASNVAGAVEMAEKIFHAPVRLGTPQNVMGLIDVRENPSYATGVGLLLHGVKRMQADTYYQSDSSEQGLWARMKSWFQGSF